MVRAMMPADEYLTKEEVESLRVILEEQLKELLSQSREAVSTLTEVRETDADPLDLAVTESNRDFTLRMADRERKLLSKIRHALERMQNGDYGTCESCGAPITYGRLMARPVATLCIDCKTEAEQIEPKKRVF
jgi:DnaK suppressor protein